MFIMMSHLSNPTYWLLRFTIATVFLWICPFGDRFSNAALLPKDNLQCSRAIPCPKEIWPRVSFWIDVYSRWNSNDAILHDKSKPERIYRVLVGQSCGGTAGSPDIERQKDQIKKELRDLAERIAKGQQISLKRERELLAVFDNPSGKTVRQAVDQIRCQSGNRDRFLDALERYDLYGDLVQRTMKQAGLPMDIQYLPFVESLYNPSAYSRVGAAGLWQIMPSTAKDLGLKLTATLDERLDPELASYAAARYLSESYTTLMAAAKKVQPNVTSMQVSPFIITSYNYGVNGMRRAIEQYGPDYPTVLDHYRSPSFQVAVKNFYASFLAARYVAKNADRYFGKRPQRMPVDYRTVVLQRPISLRRMESVFELSAETLKKYNPALTRFVWQGWRLVPAGYRLRLPLRQGNWLEEVTLMRSLPEESGKFMDLHYVVKYGDSSCAIANAFQVRCQDLIDINLLDRKAAIKVGQKLEIPASPAHRKATITDLGTYRVRKEDSACAIARKLGIDCDEMLAANRLTRHSVLQIGQNLLIPGVSRSVGFDQSYIVRRGDSACLIAARFRVPCSKFLRENGLNVRGLIFPGQTLRIPALTDVGLDAKIVSTEKVSISHTVQRDDTICEIAEKYGISCTKLVLINRLNHDGLIRVGQVLLVPEVSSSLVKTLVRPTELPRNDAEHTVRQGETACEIARKYRISCALLISTNKLGKNAMIGLGQKLRIPGATIE